MIIFESYGSTVTYMMWAVYMNICAPQNLLKKLCTVHGFLNGFCGAQMFIADPLRSCRWSCYQYGFAFILTFKLGEHLQSALCFRPGCGVQTLLRVMRDAIQAANSVLCSGRQSFLAYLAFFPMLWKAYSLAFFEGAG